MRRLYLLLSSGWTTGTIPPELGQLTNLRHLDLRGNDLTGPTPPSLLHVPSLLL